MHGMALCFVNSLSIPLYDYTKHCVDKYEQMHELPSVISLSGHEKRLIAEKG